MKIQLYFITPLLLLFACSLQTPLLAQVPGLEATNWYFGTGTDGLTFPGPTHVNTKAFGVGYEGMVVANDPATGNLIFYSSGSAVFDANNNTIQGGTGLNGAMSGTQCVQVAKLNCDSSKYHLFTNTAYDFTPGDLYYSIIDFTNNPNGVVTNLNTPITSSGIYDQGNVLVSRPGHQEFWWIAHVNNSPTYHVFLISSSGISGPTIYTFTRTGDANTMAFSVATKKLAVAGDGIGLVVFTFNSQSGLLSSEIVCDTNWSSLGDFSPSGSKLYYFPGYSLHQYDLNTGINTDLNTCCYSHDAQRAPDGKIYHFHTYNSSTPLAVINYPNLPGLACDYVYLPDVCDGEVRRFPEFLTVCETEVAIQDQEPATITLHPNPVTTQFEINYPMEMGNATNIEVHDLLGRSMQIQTTQLAPARLGIDATALPSGYYAVRITFADPATSITQKFIKN